MQSSRFHSADNTQQLWQSFAPIQMLAFKAWHIAVLQSSFERGLLSVIHFKAILWLIYSIRLLIFYRCENCKNKNN
jgi:hypothetical protein